jgi:hypothetical protein
MRGVLRVVRMKVREGYRFRVSRRGGGGILDLIGDVGKGLSVAGHGLLLKLKCIHKVT